MVLLVGGTLETGFSQYHLLALAHGCARVPIAGSKREATEAVQEGRALRPRATPGTLPWSLSGLVVR